MDTGDRHILFAPNGDYAHEETVDIVGLTARDIRSCLKLNPEGLVPNRAGCCDRDSAKHACLDEVVAVVEALACDDSIRAQVNDFQDVVVIVVVVSAEQVGLSPFFVGDARRNPQERIRLAQGERVDEGLCVGACPFHRASSGRPASARETNSFRVAAADAVD
ncbi:MAG: hypothetical protein OXK74_14650 [Gemmatimonadota bacterium]|nr:hypothetical protein [Gemmatimonadota bacterium]